MGKFEHLSWKRVKFIDKKWTNCQLIYNSNYLFIFAQVNSMCNCNVYAMNCKDSAYQSDRQNSLVSTRMPDEHRVNSQQGAGPDVRAWWHETYVGHRHERVEAGAKGTRSEKVRS